MTDDERRPKPPPETPAKLSSASVGERPDSAAVPLDHEAARRLTDRISELIAQTENLVAELLAAVEQARTGEAWRVLGYQSWTHYVSEEFGQTGRIRCGPYGMDERQHLVAVLSERGMPTRAIASITGTSHVTVARDLAAVTDVTPDRIVTGRDGKTYVVPNRPLPRSRAPNPDATDEELVAEHLGLAGRRHPDPAEQRRREAAVIEDQDRRLDKELAEAEARVNEILYVLAIRVEMLAREDLTDEQRTRARTIAGALSYVADPADDGAVS